MEKVLRGFKLSAPAKTTTPESAVVESDLGRLAIETSAGCELMFFPRLRDELRQHLRKNPQMLRFSGLRACVKQIAGAKRWTSRCRALEEQIVSYLRECAGAEVGLEKFALLVE
jgi:hypothetical protein